MINIKIKNEQKERKEFFQLIREMAKEANLSEDEAMELAEEAKRWARKNKRENKKLRLK